MLVNFKNLCMSDVERTMKGKEKRLSGHLFCRIVAAHFSIMEFNEDTAIVAFVTDIGPDPKVHFDDKEKAEKFYNFMVENMKNGVEFLEVDVKDHGAF